MAEAVTTKKGDFEIHSEAHGPHWIAWLTRPGGNTPERAVVLVGETKDEAETRARRWAESSDL
jgi:hypothetical protein